MECKERIAIYAGTFDPLTMGHYSIVNRATTMFDKIIVAVAKDTGKNSLFTLEERLALTKEAFAGEENIEVEAFSGLLVDYAIQKEACALVRGLRAISDFEYELQRALMNRKLRPEIETMFLMANFQWTYISSTIIKEVASLGGDITGMVPDCVITALREKYGHSATWGV